MQTKSFWYLAGVLSMVIFFLIVGVNPERGFSQQSSPILIGVPLPITGSLQQEGHSVLAGMEFAVHEVNLKGGLLGRKVEIRVEDTKGEPNTAGAAAEKLITKEKVFALVGGFGSTPDFGMLQSIRAYDPLIIHDTASAIRIEETFGQMRGYFHVFMWDYHRQMIAAKFLKSLSPLPKNVGIFYEDGMYGKLTFDMAQPYFKEAGIDTVWGESFKSGSSDFSGILGKAKMRNPDVLYWVGYINDYVQLSRQAKTLDVKPKLILIVESSNTRKDFGDEADGMTIVSLWSPKVNVPGLKDWISRFEKFRPGILRSFTPLGYTSMDVLLKAIERAGVLDKDKVIATLETEKFWTPYGAGLQFKPSKKAKHQLLSDETMVIAQYQGDGEEVVFPRDKASAPLRYPTNR